MTYRFLIFLLFMGGCSSLKIPENYHYKEIPTSEFTIASWQKITSPQAPYKIYIEGDGHAFNARGQITNDPTPHGTLMRELAFGDAHANVIYLARPCQYVKDNHCTKEYWSTARFAPEVISAEYQAIKSVTQNNPITLVGFSGGAQIAGLLAVQKDLNIQKVITIAGNLDHKAWTSYHCLPPLTKSLNLADEKEKFASISQHHFIGEKDNVIPPFLTKKFITDKKQITIIPQASHATGWEDFYQYIRNID